MTDAPVAIPPFARDRHIQAWAACSGLSQAGDAAWTVALAWAATSIAGPATAGAVIAAGTIPRAIVALYGGTLADRYDARRVMIAANAGRVMVLLFASAVVITAGLSVPLLLVVTVAFGVLDAVYLPANSTLPRRLVRHDDLPAAAGLFQVASRAARFTCAPLGGLLVASAGLSAVMLADAVSFVIVSVFLALWLRPRLPRAGVTTDSARRDLVAGFAYLRRVPSARALVMALSGLNLFVGPALAIGMSLRVHHSGWSAMTLGTADALVGVGAALGALAAMHWHVADPAHTGLLVLIGQACAIALIGPADRPVLYLATATIGVTAGFASAQLSGAFQQRIDPAYLGRMSSLTSLGDDALMPAAMAGFGALAAATGLIPTCLTTGAIFAAFALSAAARLNRAGRHPSAGETSVHAVRSSPAESRNVG